MTTTLSKAQRFAIADAVDNDLNIIENGVSALFVFQDALTNGAHSWHNERGEEALQHIIDPIHGALARVRVTLGICGSEEHEEPSEPDANRDDVSARNAATEFDLEEEVIDLRNGLAALDMMMLALDGNGVGNDKIASRGLRFAQENMSSALNSLAEKVGLKEHSGATA